MSRQYPHLYLSKFPEEVDELQEMTDPTASQLPLIQDYNKYIADNDLSGAQSILESNPSLRSTIFNASRWNDLYHMTKSVQEFFHDNIDNYLENLITYKNEFSSDKSYTKYDVVSYQGMTYMAIAKEIPRGTLPTNPNYFVPMSLKGDKGDPGADLHFCGQWDASVDYQINDLVSYNNTLWAATAPSSNSAPSSSNVKWIQVVSMGNEDLQEIVGALDKRATGFFSCQKTGTVFALEPLLTLPNTLAKFVSCVFEAPSAYEEGDRFSFRNISYEAVSSDGKALPGGAFGAGATVHAILNTTNKTINFKLAGGRESFPAETPLILEVFTQNGTFHVPVTGKYRVTCIGKGGDGNDGHTWDASCDYAVNGAGGGAGGAVAVTLSLKKGDSYPITADAGISSFGNLISGGAGEKGRFTPPYTVAGGEAGCGAVTGDGGGYIGLPGQPGEQSNLQNPTVRNPSDGGDGGGYVPEQGRFFPTSGGKGGKMPGTDTDGKLQLNPMGWGRGLPPEGVSPAGLPPFGAGGGGGMYYGGYGYLGGRGGYGAIIIEYLSN